MTEFLIIYGVVAVLAFWPMSIAFPKQADMALVHSILWPYPLLLFCLMWFLLPVPFAILKAIVSPIRKVHAWIVSIEEARPNTVFEDYDGRRPK